MLASGRAPPSYGSDECRRPALGLLLVDGVGGVAVIVGSTVGVVLAVLHPLPIAVPVESCASFSNSLRQSVWRARRLRSSAMPHGRPIVAQRAE